MQSTFVLAVGDRPRHSALGIAWTAVTAAVMFVLAAGKARTGRALGNPVLRTEGRVTMVDGILAAAVLLGLALNAALGWWWADPAAGYVMVYYAIREVREHLPGRSLTQSSQLLGAKLAPPEEGVESGLAPDGEVHCQELPAFARHVVHMARQGLGVVSVLGYKVFDLVGHARQRMTVYAGWSGCLRRTIGTSSPPRANSSSLSRTAGRKSWPRRADNWCWPGGR